MPLLQEDEDEGAAEAAEAAAEADAPEVDPLRGEVEDGRMDSSTRVRPVTQPKIITELRRL